MHQKIEFCSYILWQGLPRRATELRHNVSPLESNVSHLPPLREVPHVDGKRFHPQADGEQQKPELVRDHYDARPSDYFAAFRRTNIICLSGETEVLIAIPRFLADW